MVVVKYKKIVFKENPRAVKPSKEDIVRKLLAKKTEIMEEYIQALSMLTAVEHKMKLFKEEASEIWEAGTKELEF